MLWFFQSVRAVLSVACALLLVPEGVSAGEFPVKAGDRVLFLGDSITEQYQYSTDLELYLTTRFPGHKLSFVNAGISGDRAVGGAARFATHVLAEKPSVLTINFGMNDGGYGAFNPGLQKEFLDNTEKMLVAAKAAGVRVVLLSPNAVDRRMQERFRLYVETQKEFYAPLAALAEKHGAMFVDQYAITRAAVEKMEVDKADKVIPYYDGFHTASPGGLLMAHAILTGMGAPAVVSEAKLEVGDEKVTATGCEISKLETSPRRVAFTRVDAALPLPVQQDWVTLLPYVNQLEDLNKYTLQVGGLEAGKYVVTVDGEMIATLTAEELAAGVNLGNVTTGPIHAQSQQVLAAINEKNGLLHRRFRDVVMFNIPAWLADVATERKAAELAKRWTEIEARQAKIYDLAQPKPRAWVIERAGS